MPTLADRLRRERRAKNLSQDGLAKLAGVSQGLISQMEMGAHTGSKHLIAIARALSINPIWLETGCGSKESADREWPFSVSRERYMALAEEHRNYIDTTLSRLVSQIEKESVTSEVELDTIDNLSKRLQHILPRRDNGLKSLEGGEEDDKSGQRKRKSHSH